MAWFNNLMQRDEFFSVSHAITEGKGPGIFRVILILEIRKLYIDDPSVLYSLIVISEWKVNRIG